MEWVQQMQIGLYLPVTGEGALELSVPGSEVEGQAGLISRNATNNEGLHLGKCLHLKVRGGEESPASPRPNSAGCSCFIDSLAADNLRGGDASSHPAAVSSSLLPCPLKYCCRSIRRHLGQALPNRKRRTLRSKSDNCLNRIPCIQLSSDEVQKRSRFSSTRLVVFRRKRFRRFSYYGLSCCSECKPEKDSRRNPKNIKQRFLSVFSSHGRSLEHHRSSEDTSSFPGSSSSSSVPNSPNVCSDGVAGRLSTLKKSASLQLNKSQCQVKRTQKLRDFGNSSSDGQLLGKDKARRTRSLERNHRCLVTLDASCSYSRGLGNTHAVGLSHLPPGEGLNGKLPADKPRYHPDPTSLRNAPSSSSSRSRRGRVKSSSLEIEDATHTRVQIPQRQLPSDKAMAATPSSSIVRKPARGWLHPEHLFAKDGVNYNVRYVGCIEVNTSMKVLDFDTRSSIAKECIHRVCEASGLKPAERKKRPDKKVARMLGASPSLEEAGGNVQLTITSLWLKLSDLDTGNAIFVHEMPNISFASGGDTDTLDFVAYVAKSRQSVRSCFVLECPGGIAQEVITTVGQAFELRFKEFLKRTPVHKPPPLQLPCGNPANRARPAPAPRLSKENAPSRRNKSDEVEYYNDLPGKSPPETSSKAFVEKHAERRERESVSSNLIDLNTEIAWPKCPEYINGDVLHSDAGNCTARAPQGTANADATLTSGKDPFDMSPFAKHPPDAVFNVPDIGNTVVPLEKEPWFHGPISRKEAEDLMTANGGFLVRESQGSAGQYVLTGMQGNSKKHLLLVDPEGVVRTKDRTFNSVSHLIDYHRRNGLPIISAESALRLKVPIVRSAASSDR